MLQKRILNDECFDCGKDRVIVRMSSKNTTYRYYDNIIYKKNKDKHTAWIASSTVLSQMYVVI